MNTLEGRPKVKAQISVHACCRHSDVFSHLKKWLTSPLLLLCLGIIFGAFRFYIYKKIQNITAKRISFVVLFVLSFDFVSSCVFNLFFYPFLLQSLTYWQSIQYFTTEQDWKVTFDLSNQIKARILYPIREVNWKLTSSKQHNKPMVWRELSGFSCALTWAPALGDSGLCRFVQLDVDHWEFSS